MTQRAKNFILTILSVIAVAALSVLFNIVGHTTRAKEDLNQERYLRLTTEENLEKAKVRISSLETELARMQNKIKNTERILEETAGINHDLKINLDKTASINEHLKKKVKELEEMSPQQEVEQVSNIEHRLGEI